MSPRRHWGEGGLSGNPSITPEFVALHIGRPWHWGQQGLSSNRQITAEFVAHHIGRPWDWGQGGLSSCLFTTNADSMEKFRRTYRRIRLIQEDLVMGVTKRRFKPGGPGFVDAKDEFNRHRSALHNFR